MTVPVIAFRDVHKHFARLQVLNGLELAIDAGEIYGFLGRNGAGKSTAIRALLGMQPIDRGEIRLFGQPIARHRVALRQRIGYVAQEQRMHAWMTPRHLGRFLQGLYPRWDDGLYTRLLRRFELPSGRRLGSFSGGMKAQLALSVALSSQPELLVLDEPTAGMDPVARHEFFDLVRWQLREAGTTVFFSTHLVDEVDHLASRVGIIDHGRMIYDGTLPGLGNGMQAYLARDHVDPPLTVPPGRVLLNTTRRGRRFVVVESGTPATDPAWQRASLTLEDMFVARVSGESPGDPAVAGVDGRDRGH